VVCIQEAHEYRDKKPSQVHHLARLAGYKHAYSVPVSASHLEDNAKLSLGILSMYPIGVPNFTAFPLPALSAIGPTGENWIMHEKGILSVAVQLPDVSITLVNVHCFPFHYFESQAAEKRFASIWQTLVRVLLGAVARGPTIACIDLNSPQIEFLLEDALLEGRFVVGFPPQLTTSMGVQQDFIVVDQAFEVAVAQVVPTRSDHFLCLVTARLV
jgi:endonuclease/exonuclease/phosphatase family metal-dependent hydrolase